MVGSTLGPYRICRLLGEGGMGAVYEAVNESIERRVAIKILSADTARNPKALTRFFNEARAINRIAHPSIVQVQECGRGPDGIAYIVLEYLPGETLAQRLGKERKPLQAKTALEIGWQVAAALAAAHEKGIIHRDLKPANLMLVADPLGPGGERVKVLDFGIAKLVSEAQEGATAANVVMGTPRYMSPEQFLGAGLVDDKCDVYSLGLILYEMLARQAPFVAEGAGEFMGRHLFQEPQSLAALRPELPAAVVAFVHRLLAKQKGERPSMAEAAERLARLAAEPTPTRLPAPPALPEKPMARPGAPRKLRWQRLVPAALMGGLMAGLVMLGALLVLSTLAGRARSSGRRPAAARTEALPPGAASVPKPDAAEQLAAAESAYLDGNYRLALKLARGVETNAAALRIAGCAACNLKLVEEATAAYRKLDPGNRRFVGEVCSRSGVPLPAQ